MKKGDPIPKLALFIAVTLVAVLATLPGLAAKPANLGINLDSGTPGLSFVPYLSRGDARLLTANNPVYMPYMSRNAPYSTLFGVEMQITAGGGMNQMAEAGTNWVRRNGLLWSSVSPNNSTERNWPASLEQELINASSKRMTVVLIVRSTPTWAQAVPGYYCGPIKPGNYQDFANFMFDAVRRYSQPPYNVKFWEIWNEPDVDWNLPNVAMDDPFGCWGNNNLADPYYGGWEFGQMLATVTPAVHAADPEAKVLVGGLLMDCHPDYCPSQDAKRPIGFMEGVLQSGGTAAFDGVAFHGYDYYKGSENYANEKWNSYSQTTGPVIMAKASYLRALLDSYPGGTSKFLMNTESALRKDSAGQTRAVYVTQAYAMSIKANLRANIWYAATGWVGEYTELLAPGSLTAQPAYFAFRFARNMLQDAYFVRDVNDYADARVYEFNRQGRLVWLLWSLTPAEQSVPLPNLPLAIYTWDKVTNNYISAPVSGNILVTRTPVYIEWQ